LREVFHNDSLKRFVRRRRGQVQTDHPGLVELLPANGEVFCYIDGGGSRAQAEQEIRCKIEMARCTLQPAIFLGQFGMLPGKLNRGGMDGLSVVRGGAGKIQAQNSGFFLDRRQKILMDFVQVLDVHSQMLSERFDRLEHIETAGATDAGLSRD
jgi:hypothetical protein